MEAARRTKDAIITSDSLLDGRDPTTMSLDSLQAAVKLGLYPIVTLEKQLPNMVGNLV
jgi:hypothetical protein